MLNKQKKLTKKQEEDLDFEISFFENLLKQNPDYIEAMSPLAENYTKKGFFEQGLALDLKLTKLTPQDPIAHYNLACSYSLLNEIDLSLYNLEKAIKLGYNDFHFLKTDPDLENIRKDKRYLKLINSFGK